MRLLGCGVLVLVWGGCAHERNPGVVYYAPSRMAPPPPAPPPPGYPTPGRYWVPQPPPEEVVPAPELVPAPPKVPGVLQADLSTANSLRVLLQPYNVNGGLWTRVEASVENGEVTLRGVVPSQHERQELEQRVSGLPGVGSVKNCLEVSAGR